LILDIINNNTVTTAQAAIVKQDPEWNGIFHGLVINDPNCNHDSSVSIELLAQFAASAHPDSRIIRSDCKSAIALHSTSKSNYVKHPLAPLINRGRRNDFKWVKAHPEKTTSVAKFTNEQLGIYKADALAGAKNHIFMEKNNIGTIIPIPYASVMQTIMQNMHGTLVDVNNYPIFYNIFSKAISNRYYQYLCERDVRRNQRLRTLGIVNSDSRYWQDCKLRIGVDMYASISSKPRRDQITRIVFDWHNTGSNQFKHKFDIESAICTLCKAPLEDQQHIIHHCSHPRMIEIREYHFGQINSKVTEALKKPANSSSSNFIEKYHAIAIQPQHYSLLLGRVHSAQQTALSSLPTATHHSVKHVYKRLVKHCKQYTAMVLQLYSERQSLKHEQQQDPNSKLQKKRQERRRSVPIARRYQEYQEVISGIEQHDIIHADGTLVTSKEHDPLTIIRASSRQILNSDNSIAMRTVFTRSQKKRMKEDEPKKQRTVGEALVRTTIHKRVVVKVAKTIKHKQARRQLRSGIG
jgi:hypothetical protein